MMSALRIITIITSKKTILELKSYILINEFKVLKFFFLTKIFLTVM